MTCRPAVYNFLLVCSFESRVWGVGPAGLGLCLVDYGLVLTGLGLDFVVLSFCFVGQGLSLVK